MLGIALPREPTIADQTPAHVLTDDGEHLANLVGVSERANDDDEPLRDTRYLLADRIPQPFRAPKPDRLCGVVELCARSRNVLPSIAQHDRSQGTDRVGRARYHRRSLSRASSGDQPVERVSVASV